ncbi:MAG: ABC transporter ATP-binding protein [Anaerolinea sp.]|nr:ABC transporter ATP-binding protein [Anaerolinea sp.]
MDNQPAIITSALTKRYGNLTAVEDLDLVVQPGELFGFLGPNGAGKTTTMQMLACLLRPTAGTAIVAGHDVAKNPLAVKKSIGYLAERPFLYDQLTGYEFLRFCGGLHKMADREVDSQSELLLEMVELAERGNELIKSYSHGMRQKIAMCAALLHQPQLLLLDEPTNGLDPFSASQVKKLLRRRANEGTTVFFSTHILEVAERLCDRLAILYEGHLIAIGTLNELREKARLPGSALEDIFLKLTTGDKDNHLVTSAKGIR